MTATAAVGTHPTEMYSCYRPQTKFAKVMFLHMSVILSTGGGGEYLGRYTPPDQVHPPGTRYTPLGPGTPPEPGTPRSSACWEIRATSGRYASYWNAFLLPSATKLWPRLFLHVCVILCVIPLGRETPSGQGGTPPSGQGGTPPPSGQGEPPGSRPPPAGRTPPGADTTPPPPGSRLQHTVNERPVRILLECILVLFYFSGKKDFF